MCIRVGFFFFQAEDGIRDLVRSRGLGDVYKRQVSTQSTGAQSPHHTVHCAARRQEGTMLENDEAKFGTGFWLLMLVIALHLGALAFWFCIFMRDTFVKPSAASRNASLAEQLAGIRPKQS
eukprot:TRINITY_DN7321_c0_g1_i1.p1 TRINITY_DN7321_c0_g1~~TRINITY_DN7321_c0_g1_i1.p1  ORF type:complete len:121 (+),score=23.00 TRINITY_DN7321_c0_g1_i1:64-426(+)